MIVLASAVYYSTVSARKQVEIEYGDEQSYQSAIAAEQYNFRLHNQKSPTVIL